MNAAAIDTTSTRVEVDHQFLQKAMKWLGSAKEQGAIKELLEDLGKYLQDHFALEEAPDGFFADVVAAAPHHGSVVDELVGEHQTVLAEINGLLPLVGDDPTPASAEVLTRVAELIELLARHEHREAGLLQVTLERDIGVGD